MYTSGDWSRWFRLDGAGRPVTLTWWSRGDAGGAGQVVEWNDAGALTTPRLLLRTFRRDDLPLYAALNADPEVARYLGGR
jgi:hypothetical protein